MFQMGSPNVFEVEGTGRLSKPERWAATAKLREFPMRQLSGPSRPLNDGIWEQMTGRLYLRADDPKPFSA